MVLLFIVVVLGLKMSSNLKLGCWDCRHFGLVLWLAGWLVGQSADRLVGWLVGSFVRSLVALYITKL